MSYYAVRRGHNPGIYTDWESARKEVDGFSGAEHKCFKTEAEAWAFVNGRPPATPVVALPDRAPRSLLVERPDGSFAPFRPSPERAAALRAAGVPL